jgi:hypothetical protein
MGHPKPHAPTLLLLAAFSGSEAALAWARRRAEEAWGPVALESPRFRFADTDYYEATMGPALDKVFFAFAKPFDPATMVEIKLQTNGWEEEYAALGTSDVRRPLNLDPGYLTPAKLVLASTKDHAHRVYLHDGIFAEVTLHYSKQCWQSRPWTFADYGREDYQQFFLECRRYLRKAEDGGRMKDEG